MAVRTLFSFGKNVQIFLRSLAWSIRGFKQGNLFNFTRDTFESNLLTYSPTLNVDKT
jgi:hypothetical protein